MGQKLKWLVFAEVTESNQIAIFSTGKQFYVTLRILSQNRIRTE